MTPQDFAARLNGREYGSEITKPEEAEAKAAGLVVVFGYSDDNVELRGAISEEVGMFDGGTVCVTSEGTLMPMWEDIDCTDKDVAREYFRKDALPRVGIECEWSPLDEEGLSWRYKTRLPHATFDVIEDGEVYCRGIVFALADVMLAATSGPLETTYE